MAKKSKSNDTSSVQYYTSFQALAAATAADNPDHGDEANEVEIRSALDYPARPVEWLWPEKFPLGKVTLLIGDPGLGKSLIAIDAASRVTRGVPFPTGNRQGDKEKGRQGDSQHVPSSSSLSPCLPVSLSAPPNPTSPNPVSVAPGSVLILSAEDEIADTIRPRLDAHGADPAKIFFASELTDLRRDRGKLEAVLAKIPDCRLIVVDPVNAFVGPSDSHFHTIVRKVLAPLAEIAARRRIAILAVTHLRKNTGRAIQSAAGSMGFVAAARTVWTICRDPADPSRNLLLPVKNNFAPLADGLAYKIESHAEIDAPVIRWQAEPVTTKAEDVGRPQPKSRGPEAEDRRNAGEWLKLALAGGPQEAWLVRREGKQNGFSDRTLARALYDIGGQTTKRGYFDGWFWSLPLPEMESPPGVADVEAQPSPQELNQQSSPVTDTQPDAEQPGTFDETWHLPEENEKTAAPHPPTPSRPNVAESIAYLNQLDTRRKPPDKAPKKPATSLTGHAALDRLLAEYGSERSPHLSTLNSPPSTLAQKKVPGANPDSCGKRLLALHSPGGSLTIRSDASSQRFRPRDGPGQSLGAAAMPVIRASGTLPDSNRQLTTPCP